MIDEALALSSALVRRFEGLRLKPYLCPAGIPTVAYGATRYEDGHPVRLTDGVIDRDYAEFLLNHQLRKHYIPQVVLLCPRIDTPGRLAALVDFTYNLGAGSLKASTLRKMANEGDWEAVGLELGKWVKGGGKVLKGLVLRREAEAALL
jgi:lysozyme